MIEDEQIKTYRITMNVKVRAENMHHAVTQVIADISSFGRAYTDQNFLIKEVK